MMNDKCSICHKENHDAEHCPLLTQSPWSVFFEFDWIMVGLFVLAIITFIFAWITEGPPNFHFPIG